MSGEGAPPRAASGESESLRTASGESESFRTASGESERLLFDRSVSWENLSGERRTGERAWPKDLKHTIFSERNMIKKRKPAKNKSD